MTVTPARRGGDRRQRQQRRDREVGRRQQRDVREGREVQHPGRERQHRAEDPDEVAPAQHAPGERGGARREPEQRDRHAREHPYGALTASELAERLEVSPAGVSGAVRYLVGVGMLVRTREPGARRDLYRLHGDVWTEMFTHRAAILRRWEQATGEGAELLGPERPAGRRLAETRDFFAFLGEELPAMMDRWRARRGATVEP